MALIDDVARVCARLAPKGWAKLLKQHGLDIEAADLKGELLREIPDRTATQPGIDRSVPGFEDFSIEGHRGITPGDPARSLLYHALASPNVVECDGVALEAFPTPCELEAIENFAFGPIFGPAADRCRSVAELRTRATEVSGSSTRPMALVVYAVEYRPAVETPHRRHADLCLSRTGVARVGTAPAEYEPELRGYRPFVDGEPHAVRVLPARYVAFIAVQCRGDRDGFGPMRPQPDDDERLFWVPLHKVFDGNECVGGDPLAVVFEAHHVNEKLRRIHLEIRRRGFDAGWGRPDIDQPPFRFTEGIAELDAASKVPGLLVPVPRAALVEPATYQGEPLTFRVPSGLSGQWWGFAPSLRIADVADNRPAPEFVHVRTAPGEPTPDLNELADVAGRARQGDYRAQHYLDFTGDGWVDASCAQLDVAFPRRVPAYSLVTAPDFYFDSDERDLAEWTGQSVPSSLRTEIWQFPPQPLCDERLAPNLKLTNVDFHPQESALPRADFRKEDETVVAIVSLPTAQRAQTALPTSRASRHCSLPDGASGTFAPGWDTSRDSTEGTTHFSTYGLGSPFPEDSKLCAALSTFWPGVAPDTGRSFSRLAPSVNPLTDEENGQTGGPSWDGFVGPRRVGSATSKVYEFESFAHVDYTHAAVENRFSLERTGRVDTVELQRRVLATARAYRAAATRIGAAVTDIHGWFLLSFKKIAASDPELHAAQGATPLPGPVFRYEFAERDPDQSGVTQSAQVNKRRIRFGRMMTVFVGSQSGALAKPDGGAWKPVPTA